MHITQYEPWMKDQVFDLFFKQYPEQRNTFPRFFENLYENESYKNDSIRVVAVIDETIIGFQSFFRWPYTYNGKEYNSFQSGNSIVSIDHRGKGIFQKLLSHIYEIAAQQKVDFLVGFPVSMSLPSFKKNGWTHLFDLQWYMKIVHPIPMLKKNGFRNKKTFLTIPKSNFSTNINDGFSLSRQIDWRGWKNSLSSNNKYFFEGDFGNQFELKINRRLNCLNEVIIGDIQIMRPNEIQRDFKSLVNAIKKELDCNIISFAQNSTNRLNERIDLKQVGFKSLNKQIHFIVKPISQEGDEIFEASNWQIFRGDLDTW